MTKPVQYLLVGFPYSGKSTLARELKNKLGFEHINIDQLKFDKGSTDVGDDDVPDLAWNETFDIADNLILEYLKAGKNVANEYAWITREWRDRARKVAGDAGFETKVIYIKVPKQELWNRWQENAETKKRFQWPKIEFERNFKDFEEPTKVENVIIFDQTVSIDVFVKEIEKK